MRVQLLLEEKDLRKWERIWNLSKLIGNDYSYPSNLFGVCKGGRQD